MTDDEGGLVRSDTHKALFYQSIEPGDLRSFVAGARLTIIDGLLKPIADAVDNLRMSNVGDKSLCKGSRYENEKSQCETFMLGVIIRSLTKMDLWPVPEPEKVQISVSQLIEKLKGFNSQSCALSHNCLAIPNMADIIKIAQNWSPIELPHLEHIQAQAKKVGLSNS
ncbi:uncharacterized protein F4822DRAFT_303392 [Hypoxylon trugodes]|uniref:uncharacterized protein n=1 Tax=Hypoxylon trugodes TaxID=326681 RepID=UPI002199D02F|nr:uncharacterized protein F4822DRAFT_303392 [Hypoxylon trugodes]KAI1388137.1 hypothetical protein F4822DRAFT_303392 [Hypoxylon trugodes]